MEIKLAIVDDDPDFLTSFADYAARTVGFARPACFESARTALKGLQRYIFDVILVDLVLGRASGTDLIMEIKQLRRDAKVLVLSAHSDDFRVTEAFKLGADGYLLKTQSLREILAAVQNYHEGGIAMHSQVFGKVLSQLRAPQNFDPVHKDLTPRERTILKSLALGHNYKDIATTLQLSTETVYSHSKRLFRKLGVRSKTEAVVRYLGSRSEPIPEPPRSDPADPGTTSP